MLSSCHLRLNVTLSFLNVLYPNVLIHYRSDPEPPGLYDIWISFMTHLWPTYGLLE